MAQQFDLIVIGGGPAGICGANTAGIFGKRVALVEKLREVGGAGINTGTLPSKTLRETALGQGLLRGVMIGAIISLALLIRRASRPHVAFLGRIPGTRRFSDRERHPDNELIAGVMIFRPESGLLYLNMDHVRHAIADRVGAETAAPKLVVLDLSATPRVDMHSAQMLGSVADELTATGIRVQAVEARSSVRDRLRAEGVVGAAWRNQPVHHRRADGVDSFQEIGARPAV